MFLSRPKLLKTIPLLRCLPNYSPRIVLLLVINNENILIYYDRYTTSADKNCQVLTLPNIYQKLIIKNNHQLQLHLLISTTKVKSYIFYLYYVLTIYLVVEILLRRLFIIIHCLLYYYRSYMLGYSKQLEKSYLSSNLVQ